MRDEDYLARQLEAQVALKKNLIVKLEKAKDLYEKALKNKKKEEDEERLEAYNIWKKGEEKKGRAQDEHGKGLVKVMMDCLKESPHEPVIESMCNVMGNVDGKLIYQILINITAAFEDNNILTITDVSRKPGKASENSCSVQRERPRTHGDFTGDSDESQQDRGKSCENRGKNRGERSA